MSDTYISLVSEKLNSADSKKKAEKIIEFLTEQKIAEKDLTNCVLGSSKGHAPAENYRSVLKKSELNLTELKTNGIELITEKQVFENGGNGLEEVNCPNCGENNIENDWGNSLGNWDSGTDSDKLKCQNCGTENSVTEFEFKPTWAFGNFGVTFWNWTKLNPKFVAELEKIIGTELKIVNGKI
jgi:predicted RNA-binding Zn-ribbon protein involved in translation (DUF1610 family)